MVFTMLCTVTVNAQSKTSLAICCTGDIYSVDMVYALTEGTMVSSVSLNVKDCIYDWNVSDGRLYISVAAASPIRLDAYPVEVVTNVQAELTPVSVKVNGKSGENIKTEHTAEVVEGTPPTCDGTGLTDGEKCSDCGVVLTAQQVIPATGPVLSASLSAEGMLALSGAITDNPVTQGKTLVAVYRADGRMIAFRNITDENQSGFTVDIEGCAAASEIKILRWEKGGVTPAADPVRILMQNEK